MRNRQHDDQLRVQVDHAHNFSQVVCAFLECSMEVAIEASSDVSLLKIAVQLAELNGTL
jgi:hypothetical protein